MAGNVLRRMLHNRYTANLLARIWNKRNQALNDTLFYHLNPEPADRILEIGFGGGYLLRKILPHIQTGMVCGVDISESMVRRLCRQFYFYIASGKLDLKQASAEHLPYPSRHFSKVCMVNSIFYWDDAETGLREIYRVLKDAGILVQCLTDKKDIEKKGLLKNKIRTFELEELKILMQNAGFSQFQVIEALDAYRRYYCIHAIKKQ